jgi:hypothetical protein
MSFQDAVRYLADAAGNRICPECRETEKLVSRHIEIVVGDTGDPNDSADLVMCQKCGNQWQDDFRVVLSPLMLIKKGEGEPIN